MPRSNSPRESCLVGIHHGHGLSTHGSENQGMQVTEGSGRLLVLAVRERSEWGCTMALVASES